MSPIAPSNDRSLFPQAHQTNVNRKFAIVESRPVEMLQEPSNSRYVYSTLIFRSENGWYCSSEPDLHPLPVMNTAPQPCPKIG